MSTKIILNPKFENLRQFVENLHLRFDEEGTVIYDKRNVIKVIPVNDLEVNIKAFAVPNIVNRFVYGNFRLSKARRSYEYATILLEKKVNTPEPIAYIEIKKGFLFSQSFYLCIHEKFDGMMRELQRGKLQGRGIFLTQFARFTADMHEKEVLHEDYSPGNILYKKKDGDYDFYLVDLNRMSFGKVTIEEGCRSLRRLWGSDEMIRYIASEYAKTRGFDTDKCIELTMHYHDEFWREFSRRHPEDKPYIED